MLAGGVWKGHVSARQAGTFMERGKRWAVGMSMNIKAAAGA